MHSVISSNTYDQGKWWQTSFVRKFSSGYPLNCERANFVLSTKKMRNNLVNNNELDRKRLEIAKNSFSMLHIPVALNTESNLQSKCEDTFTINCHENEVNLFYSSTGLMPLKYCFEKQMLKKTGIFPYSFSELKSKLADKSFLNKENNAIEDKRLSLCGNFNTKFSTVKEECAEIVENKFKSKSNKYKPSAVLNCELHFCSSISQKIRNRAKICIDAVSSTYYNLLNIKNIKVSLNYYREFNTDQKLYQKNLLGNQLEIEQTINHLNAAEILEGNLCSYKFQKNKSRTLKSKNFYCQSEVLKSGQNFYNSQSKSKELRDRVLKSCRKDSSDMYFNFISHMDDFKMPNIKSNDIESVNHQMMNRKIKQISKHSKKRRKRQKKKISKCSDKVVDIPDKLQSFSKKPGNTGKAAKIQNLNSSSMLNNECHTFKPNYDDNTEKEILLSNRYAESDSDENILFSDVTLHGENNCDSFQSATLAFILDIKELSSDSEDVELEECSDSLLWDSFFNSTNLLTGFCRSSSSNSCNIPSSTIIYESELFTSDCPESGIQNQNLFSASQDMYGKWTNLDEVNERWNRVIADVDFKPVLSSKVTFAPENELTTICPVEMWDRKGPWEQYALDRCRFKNRINELEKIISPYLSTSHRTKVFKRLQPCDK